MRWIIENFEWQVEIAEKSTGFEDCETASNNAAVINDIIVQFSATTTYNY